MFPKMRSRFASVMMRAWNGAVADSRRMRMLSDGDLERDFSGQHPLLEWVVAGDGISAWRIVSMG
jgi:hypothetical protein